MHGSGFQTFERYSAGVIAIVLGGWVFACETRKPRDPATPVQDTVEVSQPLIDPLAGNPSEVSVAPVKQERPPLKTDVPPTKGVPFSYVEPGSGSVSPTLGEHTWPGWRVVYPETATFALDPRTQARCEGALQLTTAESMSCKSYAADSARVAAYLEYIFYYYAMGWCWSSGKSEEQRQPCIASCREAFLSKNGPFDAKMCEWTK